MDVDLGGPVHYVDHGGHGSPLVLLHGLGGSRLNWMAVAPGLAEKHRVYALEYIGHGLTPLAGRKANLAGHRRLIDAFIDRVVREPATLIGNSTGGHLAIVEAALAPDKVAGLVLVDPAVPVPVGGMALPGAAALAIAPLMVRGLGEAMMMANAGRTTSEQAVYRTLKMVSPDYSKIPEEVIQAHLEAHRPRHGSAAANTAFLQTGRSLLIANLRRAGFYAKVRRVKAPVLVVQGSEDRLVPMAAIRRLLAVRPDWELHVFKGVGHVPMMEDPAAFNEVVGRWLAARERAAA
jgi:pimeloyl-ACP methyl ester carboxylesterase